MSRYMLLALIAFACVGYNELDLPILPPDDPRRERIEPATLPLDSPEVELPPAPPPSSVFYGEVVTGPSIVYVLDYSQTMGAVAERVDYRTTLNRWEVCQREAARSIRSLSPEMSFGVVVFGTSGGCGVRVWRSSLQPATPANVASAVSWLHVGFPDVMFLGGATPTAPGVIRAFRLLPDRIALLTDGQPSPCGYAGYPPLAHRAAIAAANEEGVPIDVFGVGMWQVPREFCAGVASDSGGTFFEIPTR
jgi:hypothetical protein